MDTVGQGPNPAVRLQNCHALFAANPGYGDLATFQDPAENTSLALISSGGNLNLKNEISNTWTYGVVVQPSFVPGLTFTADRIEVTLANGLTAFSPANFLRSEEHTSELQSLMRISYAVFCLKNKTKKQKSKIHTSYDAKS